MSTLHSYCHLLYQLSSFKVSLPRTPPVQIYSYSIMWIFSHTIMLVYLPPKSVIITGLTQLSLLTLSHLYLSCRILSHLWCVCLSTSVVACSLSPSIAVVLTVFILPVKDEAETASLILVLWRGRLCGEGGRKRERENERQQSHFRPSPRWFMHLCVWDKLRSWLLLCRIFHTAGIIMP